MPYPSAQPYRFLVILTLFKYVGELTDTDPGTYSCSATEVLRVCCTVSRGLGAVDLVAGGGERTGYPLHAGRKEKVDQCCGNNDRRGHHE